MERIVGRKGHYIKRSNALFESLVHVKENREVEDVKEYLHFIGAKIPGPVFRSWQAFCRKVRSGSDSWGSEAALILFYDPEKKTWGAEAPKQKLSSVHVDFSNVDEAIDRYRKKHGKALMVGTLHSHPGDATPSHTDEEDERKLDGIHIVIPNFGDGEDKGVVVHAVASGIRFEFTNASSVIDFSEKGELPFPEEWMKQVEKNSYDSWKGRSKHPTGYGGYGFSGTSWSRGDNRDYQNETDFLAKKVGDLKEPGVVLKFLDYDKSERRKIIKMVDDDLLRHICMSLDWMKDAVQDINRVSNPVTDTDRDRIVSNIKSAGEEVLDALRVIAEMTLTGGGVIDDIEDDLEEEEKEEKSAAELEKGKEGGVVGEAWCSD